MKVTNLEILHCDAGWRNYDFVKLTTISGIDRASFGSLIELTRGGKERVSLKTGETRRFLEDGDEIRFRARCSRDGFAPIGFGVCRARIAAAEA